MMQSLRSVIVIAISIFGICICNYQAVNKARDVVQLNAHCQKLSKENTSISSEIANFDTQIAEYSDKYGDISFNNNLELAQALDSLKGAELQSIVSIANKDGAFVECTEIDNVNDVIFFSEEAVKLKYKFKCTDMLEFARGLRDSAIAVDSMILDYGDDTAEVTVNSIFAD